jgi:hypothetical protein
MQVQGAATEAAAAEVTRNESVNSMRFSVGGRGWQGGGLGQRRPVFGHLCAVCVTAILSRDMGFPTGSYTPICDDSGDPGIWNKAGAWPESWSAFLRDLAQC